MTIHPDVQKIIAQFEANELHAARSGRKVMDALASVIAGSQATKVDELIMDLDTNVDALLRVMPAYAPPINVLHQIYTRFTSAQIGSRSVENIQVGIADEANAYDEWSEKARSRIAVQGASIIPRKGTVFTYTLSETVLRTIREAWIRGIEFKLIVTESRPNNDGLDTTRAMIDEGAEVEIGIDASIGELVPRADVVLVGAEAILADGSAICKVGTYAAALTAKTHQVPVYVLVDSLKFHSSSLFGQKLWLEPIHWEVLDAADIAPRVGVCGHLFDRTPAELISAIVTEKGFMHPEHASAVMLGMPISEKVLTRLGNQGTNITPIGD